MSTQSRMRIVIIVQANNRTTCLINGQGTAWGYVMLIHFLHRVPVCRLSFNFVESHVSATSLISGSSCSTHMPHPPHDSKQSKWQSQTKGWRFEVLAVLPKETARTRRFKILRSCQKMWTHQHHITTHPSSCRRTSAKAKFKLSSHHPWDTFYCLSSMFNRLPHLKQMGISNSQSPSSSEACSLLTSRKARVHRFGSLTSTG